MIATGWGNWESAFVAVLLGSCVAWWRLERYMERGRDRLNDARIAEFIAAHSDMTPKEDSK